MSEQSALANLGQIFLNKFKSLPHNLPELKINSLILASLALVIARIVVATGSAIQARGTADAAYRDRESLHTIVREICGWTLGFAVLRQLQGGIEKYMGKQMGIVPPHNPNQYPLFKALNQFRKNPAKAVDAFKPNLIVDLTPKIDLNHPNIKKLLAGVSKFYTPKNPEAFIRNIYKYAPIVLASIPTVVVAGTLLERYNRDYSEQGIAKLSKAFHFGVTPAAAPQLPVASVSSPPVQAQSPMVGVTSFSGLAQKPANPAFTGALPFYRMPV